MHRPAQCLNPDGVETIAAEVARQINDVAEHDVVSLECERGLNSVVGLMATFSAGCVPLLGSATHPPALRQSLRELSGAAAVLSTNGHLVFHTSPVGDRRHRQGNQFTPEMVAYLTATSGSTGHPKMAPVDRGLFELYVRDIQRRYGLMSTDRVLQFASPGFDVFVEEVVPSLQAGAELIIPPWQHAPDAPTFLDFLEAHKVTVANLPSSYWMAVADYANCARRRMPPSLRLMVIGSEPVARHVVESSRRLSPHTRIVNAYGTAEIVPTCLTFDCDELHLATDHPGIMPVGRPLGFLAAEINTCEDDDTTTGRLALHPTRWAGTHAPPPSDTGDLASRGRDGFVYLHGRTDLTRLKRGGVSINAESVAATARTLPGVLGATVAYDQELGVLRLAVQTGPSSDLTSVEIDARLRELLPLAALPDRIEVFAAFGLEPGLKVTRASPAYSDRLVPVRDAWRAATGAEEITEGSDFFDCGGDSIGAVRMCSHLSEVLDAAVPAQLIFAAPRFGDFVAEVEQIVARRPGLHGETATDVEQPCSGELT